MKIVTLIPYWNEYQHEPSELLNRDTTRLSGRILLNYPIELSNKIKSIDQTCLFTNDNSINQHLDTRLKFDCIERGTELDAQNVCIEQIISSFLQQIPSDIIVLLHPKSPFIKKETVGECISAVTSGEYDSAYLARVERKFAWYEGRRINYHTDSGTPHLSAIKPIILETSSLYVFTAKSFERTGTRIGHQPYIKAVSSFEGMVISTPDDMKMAEYLLDSNFNLEN
jgi:CMP-N-acetylneuraminic acid synthetase